MGRDELVEAGGDRRERRRRRSAVGGLGERDGSAGVTALGHGGLERHLAEQGNADGMFSITPTTRTKLRRAMSAAR